MNKESSALPLLTQPLDENEIPKVGLSAAAEHMRHHDESGEPVDEGADNGKESRERR